MPARETLARRWALAAAVVVVVILAYSGAPRGEFIWDDHELVESRLSKPPEPLASNLLAPFFPPSPNTDRRPPYFRPVVELSYRIETRAFGHDPAPYHVSNIAMHVGATLLLYGAALALGGSPAVAAGLSAAFGALPRLSESVAWISGRTDLLAGLLSLAAVFVWLRAGPSHSLATRRWAAAGLALLALLSKEAACGTVLALAVDSVLQARAAPAGERRRALVGRVLPLLTSAALYALLRAVALRDMGPRPSSRGLVQHGTLVLEAIGRYATLALDPFTPNHSIGLVDEPSVPHAILGASCAAGLAILAARYGRRPSRRAVLGLTLSLGTLLPALQIIPIAMNGAVVADRLLYLPLAGLALALMGPCERLAERSPRMASVVGVSAILSLGTATFLHVPMWWREELGFWLRVVRDAHPHNTAPRVQLANLMLDARRPDLALPLFESAGRILEATSRTARPAYRRVRENRAATLERLGRFGEATALRQELVRDHPDVPRLWAGLGYALLHEERFEESRRAFRQAFTLEPTFHEARALEQQVTVTERLAQKLRGLPAEALLAPDGARQLAILETRLGRAGAAEAAWLRIARDPASPPALRREAHVFLVGQGSLLAARAVEPALGPQEGALRQQVARRSATEGKIATRASELAALSHLPPP